MVGRLEAAAGAARSAACAAPRHALHALGWCGWLGAHPLLAAIALHPVSQSFLAFGELTCRAVDQRNSTWFSCQARSELRTAGRNDSRPACPAVAACTTCRLVRPLSQASTRHVAALATHFNTQFNQKNALALSHSSTPVALPLISLTGGGCCK